MSTTLRDLQLIELCTQSIQYDRQVQSACTAFDKQMHETIDDTPVVIMISQILKLADSNLIDILAWQFHVDFYDHTKPLEFRRQLVFNAIQWHMRKGTVALLQEVLDTFWPGGATIEEWFEYMDPLPPNFPIESVDEWRVDFRPQDVNTAQNRFQVRNAQLVNGEQVLFKRGRITFTLPSPLTESTTYYVINRTDQSFQVSLTSGGAAVDILTTGDGTHNEVWHKALPPGSWHDRYRFRALIDEHIITPDDEAQVLELINAYKPVSRWFEGFFRATVSTCDIAWYGAMLRFIARTSEAPDYTPADVPTPEPDPETLVVSSSAITMDGSCYAFGLCDAFHNALKMTDQGFNGAFTQTNMYDVDEGRIWEFESVGNIQVDVYPHTTSGDACGGTASSTSHAKVMLVVAHLSGVWYVQAWNNEASPSTYPIELFYGSSASLATPVTITNQLTAFSACGTHVRSGVFSTAYWGNDSTWVSGGMGGTVTISASSPIKKDNQ